MLLFLLGGSARMHWKWRFMAGSYPFGIIILYIEHQNTRIRSTRITYIDLNIIY